MTKILVTGDRGYIGPVLVRKLLDLGHQVVGFDAGYFDDCFLVEPQLDYEQITGDLRDFMDLGLNGFDAIIHLAGLSNDPLGEFESSLTEEINFQAAVDLVKKAKSAGVRRFVYASTQSIYGLSDTEEELDEYKSVKNPLTAYAKTKWMAEQFIVSQNSEEFQTVCFRPSTVFGASPNLRCDIVFNNMVACAYTTGRIEVKSDGTPWRPIIHVEDVAHAFIAGVVSPFSIVGGESFNVGVPGGNYTVREIAEAASRAVPGCELIFTNEHTDPRSYKVSFDRISTVLKDYFQPKWTLDDGGRELVAYFNAIDFTQSMFRGETTNRLAKIRNMVTSGALDANLKLRNR